MRTVSGSFAVDAETEEVEPAPEAGIASSAVETGLPRVVAAAAAGATVVAVVAARPPLLVSYDAGTTWHEGGRGLPPGVAVALDEDDPDAVVFAGRNRLYVSTDGGRFWHALAVELPAIEAVAIE